MDYFKVAGSAMIVAALFLAAAVNPAAIISTVAGNGTSALSGDHGSAAGASLSEPFGVAVDAAGNLFIADTANNRIRKVDTSGIIITVAGNGGGGFSGDGGRATSASLNTPTGVAVDAAGNLYVADTFNSRVRKVDSAGVITTVAGNGEARFSGDGVAATSTSLCAPFGVAVDAVGNLYIADTSNHRIRKVDSSGIITTVAGDGRERFSGDGGRATRASLNFPIGVTVDRVGNLFITDQSSQRIRKVNAAGVITTVAGNGREHFSPATLCGGNVGRNQVGAIFNTNVTQNPHVGLADWQFHYRDPNAKGKGNVDCTNASDPRRNDAATCGASWSQTLRDP